MDDLAQTAVGTPVAGQETVTGSVSSLGWGIESGPDAGVAMRATYIIDDKGILRHMSINDLPVGRSADEVVRLVTAFKYTDEYGEVCPASWKPGAASMVPDADKAAEYFEKENA